MMMMKWKWKNLQGHEDMDERPGMKEEKSYHDEDDRMIETGQLSRIFDLDRSAIDEQNRTVSVIFSTETPVDRNFGVEILDHDRGSVRMDRLQKRAPVLLTIQCLINWELWKGLPLTQTEKAGQFASLWQGKTKH